MSEAMVWEIIGYIGSALVLVSLLMSSIVKLRILNALGSLIFCIYAFKINSLPTAIMNVCLVIIDMYYLIKLLRSEKVFSYVYAKADDPIIAHIMYSLHEDISKYFNIEDMVNTDKIIVVFDRETIAGITAGKTVGEDIEILMDYSTPQYRDCKVGMYVNSILKEEYSHAVYTGNNAEHIPYLEKVGYKKDGNRYILDLK